MTKIFIFTQYWDLAKKVAFSILKNDLGYDPEQCREQTHRKDSFEIRAADHTIAWHKPNDSGRGYRCDSLYIDMSIAPEVVHTIILPTLVGNGGVHYFYDKEMYERAGADVFGI